MLTNAFQASKILLRQHDIGQDARKDEAMINQERIQVTHQDPQDLYQDPEIGRILFEEETFTPRTVISEPGCIFDKYDFEQEL